MLEGCIVSRAAAPEVSQSTPSTFVERQAGCTRDSSSSHLEYPFSCSRHSTVLRVVSVYQSMHQLVQRTRLVSGIRYGELVFPQEAIISNRLVSARVGRPFGGVSRLHQHEAKINASSDTRLECSAAWGAQFENPSPRIGYHGHMHACTSMQCTSNISACIADCSIPT
jgi:hypothetical protein